MMVVAAHIDPEFQSKVEELFGSNYVPCSPKSMLRANTKVSDYATEQKPVEAMLLDVVRAAVVFETPQDLMDGIQLIECTWGAVVRLKNNFALGTTPPHGLRNVLVNMTHTHSDSGIAMICELQLFLRDYFVVRGDMHALYKLVRNDVDLQPSVWSNGTEYVSSNMGGFA